jgi:LuxR family maltose regulon positive regulatory protein
LIVRLHHGAHRRLTLVSAPAGYGKTTLVTQWLDHAHSQTTWLSLDDSDNDLQVFARYLLASVRRIVPDFGGRLAHRESQPV